MRYLFYLGHPAHFHVVKNTITELKKLGNEVVIVIKRKDILEELLNNSGWEYHNIFPSTRKNTKLSLLFTMLKRDITFFNFCRKYKPDVMIGNSVEITHIGPILKIPSIVVNEDDAEIVPLQYKLVYPFATWLVAPDCCSVGKFEYKKISYPSYHELAYLHPNHFTPDKSKLTNIDTAKPYFIMRFAKLTAHHDDGREGINTHVAEKIISMLLPHGNIYITSERELEPQFEKYRIKINPLDMHHAMHFAHMYIGDSQTMAAEAAVLGTPAIRFNDFVGQIGYLEELEHKFKLTFGFKTTQQAAMLHKIDELLENIMETKNVWMNRRKQMLEERIDFNQFMIKIFSDYPKNLPVKNSPN